MNVADMSRAPPEFLEYADIAKLCKLMMGVGWITNYVGMIYNSFKYKTYGMSLMPLCCNFAWEMVYFFIYPFGSDVEKYIHTTGLAINCLVMTTAVLYAPNEWEHAPLVRRNLPLIFVTCVLGFMSAHLALAMQVGPHLGQAWSAFACQVLLTVGGLSQLISRGSSRGASYFLWYVYERDHGICVPRLTFDQGSLGSLDRSSSFRKTTCGTSTGLRTTSI